jgi:hypothetical protein
VVDAGCGSAELELHLEKLALDECITPSSIIIYGLDVPDKSTWENSLPKTTRDSMKNLRVIQFFYYEGDYVNTLQSLVLELKERVNFVGFFFAIFLRNR